MANTKQARKINGLMVCKMVCKMNFISQNNTYIQVKFVQGIYLQNNCNKVAGINRMCTMLELPFATLSCLACFVLHAAYTG